MLPGFIPTAKKDDGPTKDSVTTKAQPMPQFEKSLWKDTSDNVKKEEHRVERIDETPKQDLQEQEPELLLDDLDSLFE